MKIETNPIESFKKETINRIKNQAKNKAINKAAQDFLVHSAKLNYSYNFTWMGRPIIQYPQDMVAMQEIIWEIQPDLIIETGVAHGGSLIYYASLLELIGKGSVLGIDIDIRSHNKKEIERHPMYKRIKMIQGSSISADTLSQVKVHAKDKKIILVALDSNHTHDHVIKELESYSPFVSEGSYLVVFDTLIENMPKGFYPDRAWAVGNNPMTAVKKFLKTNKSFQIQNSIDNKLLISVARSGYLKKVK